MVRAIADDGARLPELAEPSGGGCGPGGAVAGGALDGRIRRRAGWISVADFNQSMVLAAPEGLTAAVLRSWWAPWWRGTRCCPRDWTRATDRAWELLAGNDFDADAAVITVVSAHPVGTEGFDADLIAAHSQAGGRGWIRRRPGLVQVTLVTGADDAGRIVVVIHHPRCGRGVVAGDHRGSDDVVGPARSRARTAWLRETSTSQRAWNAALAARARRREGEADSRWRGSQRPTDLGGVLDRARDRMATSRTDSFTLAEGVADALTTTVPAAFGASVNDVLLAALARAVRRLQRVERGIADDAAVSMLEGHGRYEEAAAGGDESARADLSRSVGWFTTIAPVSVDPAIDIVHAVKAAKEERLGQPDSGAGFGCCATARTRNSRHGRCRRSCSTTWVPVPPVRAPRIPVAFGAVSAPSLLGFGGAMAAQAVLTINASW